MSKRPQSFAVHAYLCGGSTRGNLDPLSGSPCKHLCGDSFYFRDNNVRMDLGDSILQRIRIGHIQYTAFVCDMHGRGMGIRICSTHPCPQAHQFNSYLFAELAGSEQHNAYGMVPVRQCVLCCICTVPAGAAVCCRIFSIWDSNVPLADGAHILIVSPGIYQAILHLSISGVANAARTRDLLNHNQVLCQLSYSHHVHNSVQQMKTIHGLVDAVYKHVVHGVFCFCGTFQACCCGLFPRASLIAARSISSKSRAQRAIL